MGRKLKLLQPVQTGEPGTGHPRSYPAGAVIDESEFPSGVVVHWESHGSIVEVVDEEPRDASGRFAKAPSGKKE